MGARGVDAPRTPSLLGITQWSCATMTKDPNPIHLNGGPGRAPAAWPGRPNQANHSSATVASGDVQAAIM